MFYWESCLDFGVHYSRMKNELFQKTGQMRKVHLIFCPNNWVHFNMLLRLSAHRLCVKIYKKCKKKYHTRRLLALEAILYILPLAILPILLFFSHSVTLQLFEARSQSKRAFNCLISCFSSSIMACCSCTAFTSGTTKVA